MSVPATIVDKLRNYEYEKRGCGDAVGDIYALIHHIAILEEEIDDLKIKAREAEAWEGRYNALLEECEAGRPRVIDGGEASRGAASMTVALDVNGYPWLCYEGGWWRLVAAGQRCPRQARRTSPNPRPLHHRLHPGGEMTPWERFAAGNDEIIPIRVIDFDADLIAAYLAPACPDSTVPRENMTI